MSYNMYKDGKTPYERNVDKAQSNFGFNQGTNNSTNSTGQWNNYRNPNYVAFGEPDTKEKKVMKGFTEGALKKGIMTGAIKRNIPSALGGAVIGGIRGGFDAYNKYY